MTSWSMRPLRERIDQEVIERRPPAIDGGLVYARARGYRLHTQRCVPIDVQLVQDGGKHGLTNPGTPAAGSNTLDHLPICH